MGKYSFLEVILILGQFLTPILWLFVKRDINRLEKNTNSKFDAFLELKGASSKAEGVLEEKERQENK